MFHCTKSLRGPRTCVDDLLLEELDRVVGVLHPFALLAHEEGQLHVLRFAGAALDGEELGPDELCVELHDLVEPHVMDCQEGGAQGAGLVFEDADDDNLAFRNS